MRLARAYLIAALLTLGGSTAGNAATSLPSAHDFTRLPAISDVSISPDGQHIVGLVSPDGETTRIAVWRTAAIAKPPLQMLIPTMRIVGVRFLKNDRLLVSTVQPFTTGSLRRHMRLVGLADLNGRSAGYLPINDTSNIVSTLPKDPAHLLLSGLLGGGTIKRVDLYTGGAEKVIQASERYYGYQADLDGVVRARKTTDFDQGKIYVSEELRESERSPWQEYFRSYAKDRTPIDIVAFTADPDIVLISASQGSDKAGVYKYDIKQRKVLAPAFRHELFDATGDVIQSHAANDFGSPIGFQFSAETDKTFWVDDRLSALDRDLRATMGIDTVPVDWTDPATGVRSTIQVAKDADIHFTSMSDDRNSIVVVKSGPRQPPEYYLLVGAKLSLLGRSRQWVDQTALGQTELTQYTARDGLVIPAFLTRPPKDKFGPGPYPTLVEPHGGPWARDEMDWDEDGWIQYFASRGYAVLQPQFRGSEGWGQKLWRAGDAEWGGKMQDDLDDGVKWMVAQHIADPARVAIFGYSYGGYAAIVAAIRPHGLYQCAIAGAGVGDLKNLADETYDNRYSREYRASTIKGLDPPEHAREVQIPILLYHGDRDATVDIEDSRKFAALLKNAGKPYRLVEIPDMGHQHDLWTQAMAEQQLTEVDSFLKTGCKPGGL